MFPEKTTGNMNDIKIWSCNIDTDLYPVTLNMSYRKTE